jgi:hypothetical protein
MASRRPARALAGGDALRTVSRSCSKLSTSARLSQAAGSCDEESTPSASRAASASAPLISLAGEREVFAQAARTARHEPAAAHVRKQADGRFGHGHLRALGGQAQAVVAAVRRDAHAAAHHARRP